MVECKHELPMLMGTADGIVCRACGRAFKSFAEVRAMNTPKEENAAEAAQIAPKRGRKKKGET